MKNTCSVSNKYASVFVSLYFLYLMVMSYDVLSTYFDRIIRKKCTRTIVHSRWLIKSTKISGGQFEIKSDQLEYPCCLKYCKSESRRSFWKKKKKRRHPRSSSLSKYTSCNYSNSRCFQFVRTRKRYSLVQILRPPFVSFQVSPTDSWINLHLFRHSIRYVPYHTQFDSRPLSSVLHSRLPLYFSHLRPARYEYRAHLWTMSSRNANVMRKNFYPVIETST